MPTLLGGKKNGLMLIRVPLLFSLLTLCGEMLSGRNNVSVVLSDDCQSCEAGASLSFFLMFVFVWREGTVCTWSLKEGELSSPSTPFPLLNPCHSENQ